MKIFTAALIMSLPLLGSTADVEHRMDDAVMTLNEIMGTPDKGIPTELLDQAKCVVVVPGVKKGAFIVGATYGKGFVSCRRANGSWSAPGTVRMEGGSFGFQIGGSETDVVLLVMNTKGMTRLMQSQFTLGAEGEVAAGPVGRSATAQTDAKMTAEILSWSRSRGVFAGIALKGATLRQDLDDSESLYGKRIENKDIVASGMAVPATAAKFVTMLNRYSPARK